MGKLIVAALAGVGMAISGGAFAQARDCEELKTEIEAKIKKNGVDKFTLDIVDADKKDDGKGKDDGKVVGTCDGGAKKIVYKKG